MEKLIRVDTGCPEGRTMKNENLIPSNTSLVVFVCVREINRRQNCINLKLKERVETENYKFSYNVFSFFKKSDVKILRF